MRPLDWCGREVIFTCCVVGCRVVGFLERCGIGCGDAKDLASNTKQFKNYLAFMQNFSNRLAQSIAASGKPKGALAAHTGVALSTVSRWLGGTVPKAETLEEIAEFLGVDAKWLLTGQEEAGNAGKFSIPKFPGIGDSACVVREDPAIYGEKPPETMEERMERMEREMGRLASALEAFGKIRDGLDLIEMLIKNPPKGK